MGGCGGVRDKGGLGGIERGREKGWECGEEKSIFVIEFRVYQWDVLESFSCLYALLEVKKSERRGQGYHMGRARIFFMLICNHDAI